MLEPPPPPTTFKNNFLLIFLPLWSLFSQMPAQSLSSQGDPSRSLGSPSRALLRFHSWPSIHTSSSSAPPLLPPTCLHCCNTSFNPLSSSVSLSLMGCALLHTPQGWGQWLGFQVCLLVCPGLLPGIAALSQTQSLLEVPLHGNNSPPYDSLFPNCYLFPIVHLLRQFWGVLESKALAPSTPCPNCPCCCEISKGCFLLLPCVQHSADTSSTVLTLFYNYV